MERRLAAILAADVVGYSRLMGDDEARTLDALRVLREELIQPKIADHRGRIVKLLGDGLLAEFPSAVEAVHCAVEVQTAVRERNREVPEHRRIALRMGINIGDVVVEMDDIFGDGVNVAARLEGLARPGGICISGNVYEQLAGKTDIAFEDAGRQTVKNIANPVPVWRWTGEADGPAVLGESRPDRPSIAVLPFDNMSGDPEQAYFSDGLTEDLITALTHWRSFPVIARNSSFTYKGKAANVVQIARELGAAYVLEGSVRKAGQRVRISVQLIDGRSGHHVWAERYDRDLVDVFDLQDELTRRIAAILVPELSRAERQRSVTKRPSDLGAWDCCLRGEAALERFTPAGNREARAHFERAIALDPNYSDAYAGLAHSHNRDVLLQCADDKEKALAQAVAAAERAIELDPESARAHHELSTAHIWHDRHDLALEEAHIAVRLNPNDAVGLHMLGNKSDLAGDPEGISRMEEAQQLNPRDPQAHAHLSFLARAYLNARRYDDAIETARVAIRRREDYPNAHFILAIALAHCDRLVEARQALDDCERLAPGLIEERRTWRPYTDDDSNHHIQAGLQKILERGPGD